MDCKITTLPATVTNSPDPCVVVDPAGKGANVRIIHAVFLDPLDGTKRTEPVLAKLGTKFPALATAARCAIPRRTQGAQRLTVHP